MLVLLVLWLAHALLSAPVAVPAPAVPAPAVPAPALRSIEPIGPAHVEHGWRARGLAVQGRAYRVTCRVLGPVTLYAAGYEGPTEAPARARWARWVFHPSPCQGMLAVSPTLTCYFPASPGRTWTVLADRLDRVGSCVAEETGGP